MVSKEDILLFIPIIILFIVIILGLSGVFSATLPGGGTTCNLPSVVCAIGTTLGFPEQWLNTTTFLWYSFIPLMGIWLIIFGFLDRIKIFKRSSINGILSFLIAFSMIPLGIFVMVVSILFSIMGVYSVVLFVALFFIGVYLYSRGLIGAWRHVYGAYDNAINEQKKLTDALEKEKDLIEHDITELSGTPPKYRGVRQSANEARRLIEGFARDKVEKEKRINAAKVQISHLQRTKKATSETLKRELET
jgi:uncharacterized membrane protein